MKDIQEEIDLQSLVNDAMAEFQEIHQEMERQKERARLAEKNSVSRRKSGSALPNRNDRSPIKAGHSHDKQDLI
nr:hypothetical protein [Escherichia coli]UGK56659.1 hypothetical protein [Escherichia coli]